MSIVILPWNSKNNLAKKSHFYGDGQQVSRAYSKKLLLIL